MKKRKYKERTIDQICKGLRILEKYNATASAYGKDSINCLMELQELEFIDISKQDRELLLSLNWETNGAYLWWI